MENTEKTYLRHELENNMNTKINEYYEKIRDMVMIYSTNGYSKISVFFPAKETSTCLSKHDAVVYKFSSALADEFFQKKLIDKFREEKIKLKIGLAPEKKFEDTSVLANGMIMNHTVYIYGGYILELFWDRDYSDDCCCII